MKTGLVQNFKRMFDSDGNMGLAFNQRLNSWQMGSATDMSRMFADTKSFDQNIDSWQTGSVMIFHGMFISAAKFNQPLNSWQTSSATSIQYMF